MHIHMYAAMFCLSLKVCRSTSEPIGVIYFVLVFLILPYVGNNGMDGVKLFWPKLSFKYCYDNGSMGWLRLRDHECGCCLSKGKL